MARPAGLCGPGGSSPRVRHDEPAALTSTNGLGDGSVALVRVGPSLLWLHLWPISLGLLLCRLEVGDQRLELGKMGLELVWRRHRDGVGSRIVMAVGICASHALVEPDGKVVGVLRKADRRPIWPRSETCAFRPFPLGRPP